MSINPVHYHTTIVPPNSPEIIRAIPVQYTCNYDADESESDEDISTFVAPQLVTNPLVILDKSKPIPIPVNNIKKDVNSEWNNQHWGD